MTSERRHEGYIIIDHSASPGLPEDVARAAGIDPKFAGEGKVFETASLTCSHCRCVVLKNPLRQRERHICMKCGGHYICDLCHAKTIEPDYVHQDYFKRIDTLTERFLRGIEVSPPSPALITSKGDLNG
jgi:hypothetical protein